MSAQADRELLETNIARMREEMLTELSRRHNWERQERNWESQEKYWLWQTRLLLGTLALGVIGLILRAWP